MIHASEFNLEQLQLTGFDKKAEIGPSRGLSWAITKYQDDFDSVPLSFPDNPAIPSDIPLVQLSGSTGRWRFEVARSRINLYRVRSSNEQLSIDDASSQLMERFLSFMDFAQISFDRLAIVAISILKRASPSQEIARHFLREEFLTGPVNRPETFEIHSHKKYSFDSGQVVNSWVRVRPARVIDTDEQVIAIEQDINTPQEEQIAKTFTRQEIEDFGLTVRQELNVILAAYFPNQGVD